MSSVTLERRPTARGGRVGAPHAVVIGAGFGGLAAAVRLLARGYRVTVFDRLEQAGGRARVFRQDGFTFDAGPTVITAPFLLEELWELAGRRMADDVTLVPVEPFYRVRFDDGTWFDYGGTAAQMREQVRRLAPGDVEGYERFAALSEKIFDVGFTQLADVPFSGAADMAKILPSMMRLKSYRSVYGLVSSMVNDERLRQALSFHPLLVGGNPFQTTSIYCLITHLERRWGVHYAMGGTGAIVRALVRLIVDMGGTFRLGEEAGGIAVSGGRATGLRLSHGGFVPADVIVSNADAGWTFGHLVPREWRGAWTAERFSRAEYSMGLFVWYFGTRRRYADVAHHSIVLGPRYKGLLDDIFRRKVLADDMSLYLHRPTATDPSMAPPGCDAFYVLAPVPNLDGAVNWWAAREEFRSRIERRLEETVLPGLGDALVTSRILTPDDFARDYLSPRGAGFSLSPLLTQSAGFRPPNQHPVLENLFLVGAGTHPGAGVPGVLSSARVLDALVPHAA